MAIAMSLSARVPAGELGGIVTGGAVALAPVYVAVVFGALLGRVTIETGIARTIVNLAAEYGGEQPFALALGLVRDRRAALHVALRARRDHHGRIDRVADHDDRRRAAHDRRDARF